MPEIIALHAEKQWRRYGQQKDPEETLIRKHVEALSADGFEVAVKHIMRSSLLDGPSLREMMFGRRKRFMQTDNTPLLPESGGPTE